MCVKSVPVKKRGRPFLLGEELDTAVKSYVKAVCEAGGVVNASITITAQLSQLSFVMSDNGGPNFFCSDSILLKEGEVLLQRHQWPTLNNAKNSTCSASRQSLSSAT